MRVKLLFRCAATALFALLWTHTTAYAQAYPVRPIRIVVPFPPGGTSDILARSIGQKLTEEWGQPVIADNRPGAAGNIASEYVARSKPDGYTLYINTVGTHAINPAIYTNLTFDAIKDFTPRREA